MLFQWFIFELDCEDGLEGLNFGEKSRLMGGRAFLFLAPLNPEPIWKRIALDCKELVEFIKTTEKHK